MSLKYFARYRFNTDDPAEEESGLRDLAIETGNISTESDATHGNVLVMDGQTSLLSAGNFDNISADHDRSFSFWIRNDDTSTKQPVFCYGELQAPNTFVWYASNELASPEFYDYSTRFTDTSVISQGSWVFYAVIYSSGNLKVYVDGVLSSTLNVGTLSTGTIDPLRIGTDGIGGYLSGALLDLRVFENEIVEDVVKYIFSSGPNYESELGTAYIEEYDTRGLSMAGSIMCRSTYGVQKEGETQNDHFYSYSDQGELFEAARVEHSQDVDGTGNVKFKVKDSDNTLKTVIETTPKETRFTNNDKAILFSSEGVSILNETVGGMYFGAGRDFRITVNNNKFVVQAFSSITEDYVTKMEVSP